MEVYADRVGDMRRGGGFLGRGEVARGGGGAGECGRGGAGVEGSERREREKWGAAGGR